MIMVSREKIAQCVRPILLVITVIDVRQTILDTTQLAPHSVSMDIQQK